MSDITIWGARPAANRLGRRTQAVIGCIFLLPILGLSDCAGDPCDGCATAGTEGGQAGESQADDGGVESVEGGAGAGARAGRAGTGGAKNDFGGAGGGDAGGGHDTAGQAGVSQVELSVVGVLPENAALEVEPETSIEVTFNSELDPATVNAANIQLLDGDSVVPSHLDSSGQKITITPASRLALLTRYRIAIGGAVASLSGSTLPEPYSSVFTVRDGVWKTTEAVKDSIYQISPSLPMDAAGNVLVAWTAISKPGKYCPTSARWFASGKPVSATKLLTDPNMQECDSIVAASNAAGVAAVVWQEDEGGYAQQYRNGSWLPDKVKVSSSITTYYFGLGVAGDGQITFIEQAFTPQARAWRTDAAGNWAQTMDVISLETAQSGPQIVFDGAGNGFVAWRAHDATYHQEIVVARRTSAEQSWQMGETLPGSLAPDVGSNADRGVPAIAVDANGGALSLWIAETGTESKLMSSRFSLANGWSEAVAISGDLTVQPVHDRPALVFDGKTFVAAWTAQDGVLTHTYSARYDMMNETWSSYEVRTRNAETPSLARMPALAVDGHGNLLLVWARGSEFAYERYVGSGPWSAAVAVPGGKIDDGLFETGAPMPLAINADGRAALMWSNRNGTDDYNNINLASFF